MVVIVSTAASSKTDISRARESIASQRISAPWFVGLGPEKAALENLVLLAGNLTPETIVIWLDADDALATPYATQIISQVYMDPDVWVTYGQFQWKDGRLGFAREGSLDELRAPRRAQWIFTHLRTFRAGLLHKIKPSDLQRDGKWLEPTDMAVMYPLIEMAGPEHVRFLPFVLCNYLGTGGEPNDEQYIRAQPPYERLTERPW